MNESVIVIILNCKKYHYKRTKQLETWIPDIKDKIRYFHIIGEEDLDRDYKFDHSENILYVKCKDDYLSLPSKTILAIQAIYETFDNFQHIFKTDDDQYVLPNFWRNYIFQKLKRSVHYGGLRVDIERSGSVGMIWTNEHPEAPMDHILEKTSYCGGRFYILSREACSNLLIKKEKFRGKIVEDHSVGLYLDEEYKKGGLYFNINMFFKTRF